MRAAPQGERLIFQIRRLPAWGLLGRHPADFVSLLTLCFQERLSESNPDSGKKFSRRSKNL